MFLVLYLLLLIIAYLSSGKLLFEKSKKKLKKKFCWSFEFLAKRFFLIFSFVRKKWWRNFFLFGFLVICITFFSWKISKSLESFSMYYTSKILWCNFFFNAETPKIIVYHLQSKLSSQLKASSKKKLFSQTHFLLIFSTNNWFNFFSISKNLKKKFFFPR